MLLHERVEACLQARRILSPWLLSRCMVSSTRRWLGQLQARTFISPNKCGLGLAQPFATRCTQA